MNESNEWGMNNEQEKIQAKESRKDCKLIFHMKNNNDNANEKWNGWDDNNNNEWANMNKLFEVE